MERRCDETIWIHELHEQRRCEKEHNHGGAHLVNISERETTTWIVR